MSHEHYFAGLVFLLNGVVIHSLPKAHCKGFEERFIRSQIESLVLHYPFCKGNSLERSIRTSFIMSNAHIYSDAHAL